MATTRSKTLGCGSLSSWMRILRLSLMGPAAVGGRTQARRASEGSLAGASGLEALLRRERVLGGVLLRQDLLDLRLVLHGALDGQLGRLVVELVDLVVVLGLGVDEHAAHADQVVRRAFRNHA